MIIGIDGNEANVSRRVGISEYSFELLKQFKEFQFFPSRESMRNVKFRVYLKNIPMDHMPEESERWRYKVIGPRKFWTQFGLPLNLYITQPLPDIFFSPTHYAPRFSPVPTAISIMDVSYIHFPKLFAKRDLYQLRRWTAYSVRNAAQIFTISESSKNDIIKYYKVLPEKVIVTYPGIREISNIKHPMSNIKLLQEKYGISKDFVLFVGTIQPRKNISRLIDAFSQVIKKHKDIQLIVIGKKGWLYEPILKKPSELGISQSVKFLDFVSDDELPIFYKNAVCYTLPSLYEGFGLPVLEAMQYGCPVITSNVSSLPEAGGDAALYINPKDVADIAKKITELVENTDLRKKLIEKGYTHVKKFSLKNTAEKTLEVL